jgi:hypothetical protein
MAALAATPLRLTFPATPLRVGIRAQRRYLVVVLSLMPPRHLAAYLARQEVGTHRRRLRTGRLLDRLDRLCDLGAPGPHLQ